MLPFTDPGVLPNVPSTIYTSPEVATIGLSEKEAMQQHGSNKVVVYQRHLSHVDRAICDNAQDGLIKIVCLKKNLQILGATIAAPVAGEMISEIAVMMKAKMSFDKVCFSSVAPDHSVCDAVSSHPCPFFLNFNALCRSLQL